MLKQIGLLATAALGLSLGGCVSGITDQSVGHNFKSTDVSRMQVPYDPQNDRERHYESVGGAIMITWYQGFPGRRVHAVIPTAQVLDDIAYAAEVCHVELKFQQPGGVKSIGTSAGVAAGSTALGIFTGSAWAFPLAPASAVMNNVKNGTAQSGIGGFANGVVNHYRIDRVHLGICVNQYLNDGQHAHDFPEGIHVQIDEDNTSGQPISAQAGPIPRNGPVGSGDSQQQVVR